MLYILSILCVSDVLALFAAPMLTPSYSILKESP